MPLAYFDCFAGAGGDMIVAALLSAGCKLSAIRAQLATLPLDGYAIRAEPANRAGISGTRFCVDVEKADQPDRHLDDILAIIDAGKLPARAAERAGAIFRRLAQAEAQVHGISIREVHFHEVGAVDSIVDIVAACIGLELLGVDRVVCSEIPTGRGTLKCDHGVMPIPAPATAELLRGLPVKPMDIQPELTTPTVADVFTTLGESFGPARAMEVTSIGYGAGTREHENLPNMLRVFVGSASDAGQVDSVVELSANIDDSTGEIIGSTITKLISAGCLDAWATPINTKKSRPAWMLSALCSPDDVNAVETIIFAETTTFGIRRRTCTRTKLLRQWETVETVYGPIRIKTGRRSDDDANSKNVITAQPEFDDCLAAAESHHCSVREVLAIAEQAYRQLTQRSL